jgi:hypothetical protein
LACIATRLPVVKPMLFAGAALSSHCTDPAWLDSNGVPVLIWRIHARPRAGSSRTTGGGSDCAGCAFSSWHRPKAIPCGMHRSCRFLEHHRALLRVSDASMPIMKASPIENVSRARPLIPPGEYANSPDGYVRRYHGVFWFSNSPIRRSPSNVRRSCSALCPSARRYSAVSIMRTCRSASI